ncbi:hypothetical protein VNO80_28889 [Phaseolus coccineus]|uniref:Uncharacterized protein n=1 Tax=Phaseolus coccineus TaxID=3886 RepID=A0AAN9LB74_PHACN
MASSHCASYNIYDTLSVRKSMRGMVLLAWMENKSPCPSINVKVSRFVVFLVLDMHPFTLALNVFASSTAK